VFSEFSDQRLYRLDPGTSEPTPISPAPDEPAALRYADPQLQRDGTEVWCLRESHAADGTITRDLCAVPLDGSAADNPGAVRSLVGGSDFLAHARLSPNGDRLAWIAWNHPQMPWDGTELRVAELAPDGSFGPARTLIGSATESVMQPEWLDNDHLSAISDRTDWWNLYRIEVASGEPYLLYSQEADYASPMWSIGSRWYAVLPDGRLLAVRMFGTSQLGIIDPATGTLTDIELGNLSSMLLGDVAGGKALLTSTGSLSPLGIRLLDWILARAARVETEALTDAADKLFRVRGLRRTFAEDMQRVYLEMADELREIGNRKHQALPNVVSADDQVTLDELSHLKGTEFDRAFAENIIAAHRDAIAAFQLYASSGADPELRGFADRRLPKLRRLLAAAEDVRKSGNSE